MLACTAIIIPASITDIIGISGAGVQAARATAGLALPSGGQVRSRGSAGGSDGEPGAIQKLFRVGLGEANRQKHGQRQIFELFW
jgi:hypothetical protein